MTSGISCRQEHQMNCFFNIQRNLRDELNEDFSRQIGGACTNMAEYFSPKQSHVNHDGDSDSEHPIASPGTIANSTSPPAATPLTLLNDNSNLAPGTSRYPGDGYNLPIKANSATDIWSVWYGIGKFQDIPVPGGVKQMETKYKSK